MFSRILFSGIILLCFGLTACDDSASAPGSSSDSQTMGILRDTGGANVDLGLDGSTAADADVGGTGPDMAPPGRGPCGDRVVAQPGQVQGMTEGESVTAGTCGGAGPEKVAEFTAPQAGRWIFDTEGSALNTVLYVRSVCNEPASELACNDDDQGEPHSEVGLLLNMPSG